MYDSHAPTTRRSPVDPHNWNSPAIHSPVSSLGKLEPGGPSAFPSSSHCSSQQGGWLSTYLALQVPLASL